MKLMRAGLGLVALALIVSPLWTGRWRASTDERRTTSAVGLQDQGVRRRLLGPIAHLISEAQWIRVEQARRRGRHDLVFAYGASALAWDPALNKGWELLAYHQALVLGSALRERDGARRAEWLRAGLETARRGERVADQPERLALLAGLLLQLHAERDEPTPWPGGTQGLWRAAHAAYVRAQEAGSSEAEVFASYAHEQLHAEHEEQR